MRRTLVRMQKRLSRSGEVRKGFAVLFLRAAPSTTALPSHRAKTCFAKKNWQLRSSAQKIL
jgi:hypothetical protein